MAIKKLPLSEAIKTIQLLNPELAKEITLISPDEDHYLYEISYPYGAVLLDKGMFQVPNNDNHIVPINHSTIGNKIKEDLGYSGTIPLGLVVENTIEAFMLAGERVIPSSILGKGQMISLWRVLDSGQSFHAGKFWNITSGSRSIAMLPKITDTANYKNLKSKFSLKLHAPQTLTEHWFLFTKIANHPNFSQPWNSSILFFPKQWMEHKKENNWKGFYHLLLDSVWQSSNFRRNQFVIDFVFSLAQQNRNLKPNPNLADIVRHLIAIAGGAVDAFCPAIDNTAAPITGLQKIFTEVYGLKKYFPTILHMHHFSPEEDRPVYYSLQFPTTTFFSPKSRKVRTVMAELQEVKYIMEILLAEILKGNLEVENTPLYDLAENIRYSYFHSEKDKSGEILLANEILTFDKNFSSLSRPEISLNNHNCFSEYAPFLKGCISIAKAK